jgi:hypothetical protein
VQKCRSEFIDVIKFDEILQSVIKKSIVDNVRRRVRRLNRIMYRYMDETDEMVLKRELLGNFDKERAFENLKILFQFFKNIFLKK